MELSGALTSAKAQQSLKFNQALIYGYKLLTPTFKIHPLLPPIYKSTRFKYNEMQLYI